MKKIVCLLLVTSLIGAYSSSSSGPTSKGVARAARAGNREGITQAQIAAGVLIAAGVAVIASVLNNPDSAHTH